MTNKQQAYVNKYLRAMWFMIVLLAEFVGVLAGLAIGIPDFALAPGTGVMAMGMVIVLALTVAKIHKLRAG